MELNEIMRLIWQGLINVPEDAPERQETIRAYGALGSHLGYTPPGLLLVLRPDGYTEVRFAGEAVRTYSSWINIAEDIKQQRPDISFEVNTRLGHIASEMPEAEDSKRWLVEKARELGIT